MSTQIHSNHNHTPFLTYNNWRRRLNDSIAATVSTVIKGKLAPVQRSI